MVKQPTPIMDEKGQRFMAFHGVLQWARAVVVQRDRVVASTESLREIAKQRSVGAWQNVAWRQERFLAWRNAMEDFRSDRHFLLIAADQLLEHRAWIKKLGTVPGHVFADLDAKTETIKDLRNKNEHAIEYFAGEATPKQMKTWIHTVQGASSDSSSTLGGLMGGRLGWDELAAIAEKLLVDLAPLEQAACK